jgi:type II secretory pathway component PulF
MSTASGQVGRDRQSLLSSLPLESLVRSLAASNDAVAGLQAMALEIGGRDGAKIKQLADRLQRGEMVSNWQHVDPSKVSLLQAAAMDDTSLDGRVPRWVLLQDQRTQSRSRLHRIVWFCLCYLLAATVGGLAIQLTFISFLREISNDLRYSYTSQQSQSLSLALDTVIRDIYQASVVLMIGLMMLWAARQCNCFGRAIESFWNRMPLIGSTFRAIDLAQMSEAIYQSLSAGWTYPQALRTAASQAQSALLRDWLIDGAERLDRGESFETVMNACPLHASLLAGMSQILSSTQPDSSMLDQWQIVSDRLHQLMIRRLRRISMVLAPASVMLSIAILVFGWGWAMISVFDMLNSLMW